MCRKKTKIYTAEIYGQPQEGGIGGQAALANHNLEIKWEQQNQMILQNIIKDPLWISATSLFTPAKWWQFRRRRREKAFVKRMMENPGLPIITLGDDQYQMTKCERTGPNKWEIKGEKLDKHPYFIDEWGDKIPLLSGKEMEELQQKIKKKSFSVPFNWSYDDEKTD